MYETYWQLESKPFEPVSADPFYYPGETHQGTLLKLRYALENRRGAALLAGPSGTGKTMLINQLRSQLPENLSPFVHLVFPQLASGEFLAYLADELGAAPPEPGSGATNRSLRRIQDQLVSNAQDGRHAVVVVDEAHLLAECGTLETLRLLMNFEYQSQACLTLLLVGQPAILPTLFRMETLDERLAVKALLRPFALEETISYANHRLTAAGAQRAIFDDSGLETIHGLTQGIARQINRLGDLSLLVGYADQRETIGADLVRSVSEELVALAPV